MENVEDAPLKVVKLYTKLGELVFKKYSEDENWQINEETILLINEIKRN